MLLSLLLAGTPSMVGSSPILFKGPRWQEWNPSVHENSATSPACITIVLRNLPGDMFKKKGWWYPTGLRCTSFSYFHPVSFVLLVDLLYSKPLPSITLPPFQAPLRSINKQRGSQRKCSKFWPSGLGWMAAKQEYGTCNTTMCQVSAPLGFSHLHYLQ